jgi:hypothetical protein
MPVIAEDADAQDPKPGFARYPISEDSPRANISPTSNGGRIAEVPGIPENDHRKVQNHGQV